MTTKAAIVRENEDNSSIVRSSQNESVVKRLVPPAIRSWPMQEWPTQPEMDSYQIALVPGRAVLDGPGEGSLANTGSVKFLLLPFTWKDFLARVRKEVSPAVKEERTVVKFGQIQIDLLKMEARRSDCPVILTAMEFKVLRFFVLNPERVISRDELLNQVWGYEKYPCTRTVDNHVLRLRQKLEPETGRPIHFRTIHGMGYKFIP